MTNIPLSTAEIEELRRLEKAATPGPWEAGRGTWWTVIATSNPYLIGRIFSSRKVPGSDNAAFIARSRAALPALLDEVEQSRALIAEMVDEIVELVTYYDTPDMKNQPEWHDLKSRGAAFLSRARALKEGRT